MKCEFSEIEYPGYHPREETQVNRFCVDTNEESNGKGNKPPWGKLLVTIINNHNGKHQQYGTLL
jgi:hypothetical protein